MNDFIQVEDAYYVRASSSRIDDRTHVLKCDDTFGVFDRFGDIHPHGRGHQGIYHDGTRFLSRMEMVLCGRPPLLLGSATKADGSELVVDGANAELAQAGGPSIAANLLHVRRSVLVAAGAFHQQFLVRSHAQGPSDVEVALRFGADFRDVFEVRGTTRPRRGELLATEVGDAGVVIRYRGLDGAVRSVAVEFRPPPKRLTADSATFVARLERGASLRIEAVCRCSVSTANGDTSPVEWVPHETALEAQAARLAQLSARMARIRTNDAVCNAWLERSAADLWMMLTSTADGFYPYAGVPWYSTVFGRDGIVTAIECLLVDAGIARAVLSHLSRLQAVKEDRDRDAQPGKILHETRGGEMAALGEIPFGLYYGSVDATPLFVMLAGLYWRRTGDLDFVRRLWPNVDAAAAWCEGAAHRGFLVYERGSSTGLVHQGWKDSHDAVFHADGDDAMPPIALCEVQAYWHAANVHAAELASALGHERRAEELRAAAERLRVAFDRAFWCEDIGTYALAIDGAGRPCRVRTSNPGHCLLGGIVPAPRERELVANLLADDCWSGFGIRTVSAREARYNPMAYHNGSVWPHDNALIALGMARRGFGAEANRVFSAMRDACARVELRRLPELFCGHERRPGEGPISYPVACSPQAWAVASVFALFEACLRLEMDAVAGTLRMRDAVWPDFLEWVSIDNLAWRGGTIDLLFERSIGRGGRPGVRVVRGDVQIATA